MKFPKLTVEDLREIDSAIYESRRNLAYAYLRPRWKGLADSPCAYWPDRQHCYVNGRIGGLTLAFQEVDSLHLTEAKGCKCGAVIEGPERPPIAETAARGKL